MNPSDFGDALRALLALAPSDMAETMVTLARRVGALDMVAYLADFEQAMLFPIPDRGVHVEMPEGEAVDGSPAGRAFTERRPVTVGSGGVVRHWVPVLEGSECTGVLMLTFEDELDPDMIPLSEELGMLVGAIIAITARQTDLFNALRRRRSMSLPASMQWDLLPPLHINTPEGSSTGLLVPAYDVGGDSFDHAVNGFTMDVAIMDAMGHGLGSSLTSALAMGSYRHDRREGQPLAAMHQRLDSVLSDRFHGRAFVTGQLGQLDLGSGRLDWVNAGHPRPLLMRKGEVVDQLMCRASLPWGLDGELLEQASVVLEPGDTVVFYSDGVIDGRSVEREVFGLDRLVALIEEAAASRAAPDYILRQTLDKVARFQGERIRDDATILWLEWRPGR